jgi:hypothetical protein
MDYAAPFRQRLLDALLGAFRDNEQARAMFQGGSAAFGRDDQYSDLDIQLVVADSWVEQAVTALEAALESVSPVEAKFILPQPAWHGQWQGFYRLKDAGPYLLVDIMVCKESAQTYFSEPELHGSSIVYFDRTGRVGNEHLDRDKNREQIKARIARIAATSGLFHCFVDKEVARGRPVDALVTYQQMVLAPLVETLRMIHCPDRFSFGPRYLQHDLPPEIHGRVRELYYVPSLEQLLPRKQDACRWLQANLEKLRAEGSG